ncbi:MAG: single-stranded DNA-binding protein [Elusimicrobiota bacterium]|jgi:single-strand DNA-binding protein|nr:MAG: single-stranded DNA-binding protein [Elusimicrobiota bacterium]
MAELRLPEQNTVLLTGRLTRDPELKYTASGTAMCRFGLAVNRRYKDPKSGEWKDDTTFVNCVIWREAGERVGKVVKKGSPVHVEGRLRSYDYQDKEGNKRSGIEVEARRVQILEKASSAGGSAGAGEPEPSSGAEIEEVPF